MKTIWDRIHVWLRAEAPEVLASLAPGASEEQIRAAEEAMSVRLPEEVKAVYRIHNGQTGAGGGEAPPFLDGVMWFGLDHVVECWRVWKGLLDSGNFKGLRSQPDGPIRDDWWHPLWIPITRDTGSYNCLDLAPAPGGKVGQIIHLDPEDPDRPLFADSITDWLSNFVNELEDSEWVRNPDGTGLIHIYDL